MGIRAVTKFLLETLVSCHPLYYLLSSAKNASTSENSSCSIDLFLRNIESQRKKSRLALFQNGAYLFNRPLHSRGRKDLLFTCLYFC